MKYILNRCGGVRGALYGIAEGVPLILAVLVLYFVGQVFR